MPIDPNDPIIVALETRLKEVEQKVTRLELEIANLKKPPLQAPPRRRV
jgi:hypothetical protein